MNWIEALILGLLQGLTEFLPVSSSGHIELSKAILDIEIEGSLIFTIAVHGATVLSTIVVFWKEIKELIIDFFKFRWNESTQYIFKLLVSMIPAVIIGLLFKDELESLFTGNVLLVGCMLLVTSSFLFFTFFTKNTSKEVSFGKSIFIGIAQAIAILPGISRSGATIATGLFLNVDRKQIARFSFLMVIIPILGENILDIFKGEFTKGNIELSSILVGFIAAFFSGLLACRWMIRLVQRGKLIYFAAYCLVVGLAAIIFSII